MSRKAHLILLQQRVRWRKLNPNTNLRYFKILTLKTLNLIKALIRDKSLLLFQSEFQEWERLHL